MTRFVITEAATRDVDDIWSYIADESLESADRVVDSIYEEILRVGSSPGIGHKRLIWTWGGRSYFGQQNDI
jgi:toxin ParE1/3/4